MSKKSEKQAEIIEATDLLRKYLRAPIARETTSTGCYVRRENQQTVYVIVKHVSRSGMSRDMSFFVNDADGDLVCLSWAISKVLGWPLRDRGVRVSGCGMDMGFHTMDCIARVLRDHDLAFESGNDFRLDYL